MVTIEDKKEINEITEQYKGFDIEKMNKEQIEEFDGLWESGANECLTNEQIKKRNYENLRNKNTEIIFRSDFLEKIRKYLKSELNPFFVTDMDNEINIYYNNPNRVLIKLTAIKYHENGCFGREFTTDMKELLLKMFLKRLGEENETPRKR